MTPEAEAVLTDEIAPYIRANMWKCRCRLYGTETQEELIAECIAMAVKRLDRMKDRWHTLPPKILVYYLFKALRCGMRFGGVGMTDAMASRTQREGRSELVSLDVQRNGDEDDEETSFLDSLISPEDDPATQAGRRLDWAELTEGLSGPCRDVLCSLADGRTWREVANDNGFTRWWAQAVRARIRRKLTSVDWAEELIRDAQLMPFWKRQMETYREQALCRTQRMAR